MRRKIRQAVKTDNKERGQFGVAVGRLRELHALDSILKGPLKPAWLKNARLATEIEDRKGIDIVLETTSGAIPLQVKSSAINARRFQTEKKNKIPCIVVRLIIPLPVIQKEIFHRLECFFPKIQKGLRQNCVRSKPSLN